MESDPDCSLAVATDMRNALAHGYFKIDLAIVWKTIQTDLPQLHALIVAVQPAKDGSHL